MDVFRVFAALLPVLFLLEQAKAQLPGMRVYTQLDGYPGTTGYLIFQDKRGFIWLGTDNGAACFDGKRFKVIDETDGLTDKEILAALPGNNDFVVLVPVLNNYAYYHNGKITTTATNPLLKIIKNQHLNKALRDPVTLQMWLADIDNNTFLYRLDSIGIEKVEMNFKGHFLPFSVINNKVFLKIFYGESQSCFGIYDLHDSVLRTLEVFPPDTFDNSTSPCFSDDGRYLAMYTPREEALKVYELDIENNAMRLLFSAKQKRYLSYLIIDKNNHLWATFPDGGLDYWGDIASLKSGAKPYSFFPNAIVNYAFTDRDNNKWFSTRNSGLHFISAKHWENALANQKMQVPNYPYHSVGSDSKNNIYIGHNTLPILTVIEGSTTKVFELKGQAGDGVRCITEAYGNVYMSNRQTVYSIKYTPMGIEPRMVFFGASIKDIAPYGPNALLAAGHNRAVIIDLNNNDPLNNGKMIYDGRATCILAYNGSNIMIGTPNGLLTKNVINDKPQKINHPILAEAHITDLTQGVKDYVLVSTSTLGLYGYRYKTGEVKNITADIKNPGTIRQVYRQNDSTYWLATDHGAAKLLLDENMNKKGLVYYTFFHGLPSNNVSAVFVKNDTAFIATASGLGILPLQTLPFAVISPPQVWVTGARIQDSLLYFPESIELAYNQNDIQLSLSAISFESMGSIRYRYMLEGLSENWVETESPDISFSGLPPGNYVLKVLAINPGGVESTSPLILPITIRPAFWQTNWFRWLAGILVAAGLYAAIHWWVLRKKNIQYRRVQQKRRLAELELEAIKAQINPHFVYNCLNSIQYFSYKNDYEPAKQYLDLFAKLIRQTMKYSQETFIPLQEEVDYLGNYLKLEKIRFKEKLNYELIVDEGLSGSRLLPAMMVQPYVENALKHGIARIKGTGTVRVHFSKTEDDGIRVTIDDDGPGIVQRTLPADRKPLGLRLSGSRAATYNQLFNLDIKVNITPKNNAPAMQGTRVELIIPPIAYENTKP